MSLRFTLFLLCVHHAAAQDVAAARYIFILRNPDPVLEPLLRKKVAANGGIEGDRIFYPELGFVAVVAEFAQPVAIVDNDPQVQAVRDVRLHPAGGPLGQGWVKNQFQQPGGKPGQSRRSVKDTLAWSGRHRQDAGPPLGVHSRGAVHRRMAHG